MKLTHWLIFILFVVQYFLVYRRSYLLDTAPEKLQYILLHKSLGPIILVLALLMLIARIPGKRPPYPKVAWERKLAKTVHCGLYLALLLMPLSGITMSLLSGYGLSVFGWFDFPQWLATNKVLAGSFYTLHVYTSYVVLSLVGLHIIGALYHHCYRRDRSLKQILPESGK
jgi:cytochrome b561